jgi:hypothetical protein
MAYSEQSEAVDDKPAGEGSDEVFRRAMKRFDATVIPQQEIRAHALLCRRFISIPGAQWEGEWGEQFDNSIKVEIDKLSKGVDKIVNDYRQNRIVPDFRPAGGDSDPETASTLDGIHRADSYKFKAQQARDNAFEEAAAGGFGAYRLRNEWDDPFDKDSDAQRINPAMLIADADQRVFFDGNSKLYDKSDARFAFVITADTKDAFEEEYPDCHSSWPDTGLRPSSYDWYTPEVVLKCEYYEVEEKSERLLILRQGISTEEERIWSSEISTEDLEERKTKGWTVTTRMMKRRRVHKYLLSGQEVLRDQGHIAGDCIPIVPVYGKRWFVDNQERFRGYVSKRMDSQRRYNASVSKLAETDALAPREIPIFAAEQMPPNLAALWAEQNVKRHPYALINPLLDPMTGQIVSAGPIGKVEPPSVGPVTAALLQIAGADLSDEDQDVDEVKANTSAEAMDIAATRIDAKSGIYLDNMRQSVQREGEIYLSMAREVYYEPGRTVETMSEDGDDGAATLHEPVTDGRGRFRISNDFSRGKYKVIADVTEATATRRDKTVKSSLNIATVAQAAGDQALARIATLTAVMNQDGEGMSDFQKYARRQLVAEGVVEPTDEEKQQMEEAQQGAEPDPQAELVAAQAAVLAAEAKLKEAQTLKAKADTIKSQAEAMLKGAQTDALGGPSEAPRVPDGLEAAEAAARVDKTRAEAERIRTEAAHLPAEISIAAHKAATDRMKIRRGSDLN